MKFKDQLQKDNEKVFFNLNEFGEKAKIDEVERICVLSSNLSGDGTYKKGTGINEGVKLGIKANIILNEDTGFQEITESDMEFYYSKGIGEVISVNNIRWRVKSKWKEEGVLFFALEEVTGA